MFKQFNPYYVEKNSTNELSPPKPKVPPAPARKAAEKILFKEFWITSRRLLKNTFKNASDKIITGWRFNLLLVYLDYRPAFLNSYTVKGYDFVDIPVIIVNILNEIYPGLFKYSNPLDNQNGFIWCHKKPRPPTKLEKIESSPEQWIYTGEILGYPEPEFMKPPGTPRWANNYYLYLNSNIQCQIVASIVINLSKIKYKQLINFNHLAELISDDETKYTVQQIINPATTQGLKEWIRQILGSKEDTWYNRFSYKGRKEKLKKSVITTLYDIVINKFYKNEDTSGVVLKLTDEDIKLIKKFYFKIFVFEIQENNKYMVKINPKYYD